MKSTALLFGVVFLTTLSTTLFSQNTEPPLQALPFAVWSQRMDMSAYVGKKYRLTVAIRALPKAPDAFAAAFIRNEYPKGGLRAWVYMDNMFDRPVKDSTWQTYALEYVVDKKAPWVGFGVLAYSNGEFFYDDMRLEVEAKPGEWTAIPIPNGNFESESMSPWQQTAQGVPVRVLGAVAETSADRPFEGKRCLRLENVFLK